MKTTLKTAMLMCLASLLACGAATLDTDDISLNLNSLNDSDFLSASVLEKDENISSSGNPWGTFIKEAEDKCGADPAGLEPTAATITLTVATSTNVSSFEDLVSGSLTMHFLDTSGNDASATRVQIAEVSNPTGAGPIDMDIIATRDDMNPLLERLLGGDFHVGVRIETPFTDNDDFSADLVMSIGMRAFCK